MLTNLNTMFNSFRSRILISFLTFQLISIVWGVFYISVNYKQKRLVLFLAQLSEIQQDYLESSANLQQFMLFGYHDPKFYIKKKEKHFDRFLATHVKMEKTLRDLKANSRINKLQISAKIETLINLNKRILKTGISLKNIYLQRGFKDFGVEGDMRRYAHFIEDSLLIQDTFILQLRRHEKDYLLRGDKDYETKFITLIDKLLLEKPEKSPAHEALLQYKIKFKRLVYYSEQLGINTNGGLVSEMQQHIDDFSAEYSSINNYSTKKINELQENLVGFLIGMTILLFILALVLSLILSRFLTKDITLLNNKVSDFIKSGFEDNRIPEFQELKGSNGFEISQLNENFVLLKKTLRNSLDNLERLYQEAKMASEYKSRFLANMSHEIRTPLNGILGMVHILKTSHPTPTQQDYLSTVEFSADHLLALINMILDYSKIEVGKLELDNVYFDLKGDLIKLVRIFDYKLMEKGLDLKLRFDCENTKYLFGDSLRLQQVLINLINNAIKFTSSGTIYLKVRQVSITQDYQKLKFEVQDSGIGIKEIQIASLFEAFSQADSSITRNYGGTGLGLTISNELVTLMGGHFEVVSEENVGSTFSFELDFKLGNKISHASALTDKKDRNLAGLRILLAEDNMVNQKVIALTLKKNDILLDIANNGLEACKLFEEKDYDIILMDIQMPEMDGYQATAHIQSSEKYKLNKVPIIALTANAFNEDRKKAMDNGMDDFLGKPFKTLELEGILERYSNRQAYSIK